MWRGWRLRANFLLEGVNVIVLAAVAFAVGVAPRAPVDEDVVDVGNLEEGDPEEEAHVATDLSHHREDGVEEILRRRLDIPGSAKRKQTKCLCIFFSHFFGKPQSYGKNESPLQQ